MKGMSKFGSITNLNRKLPYLMLWFCLPMQVFVVDLGFSLKPYMVASAVFFIAYMRKFNVSRLTSAERVLVAFYAYYSCTLFWSSHHEASARMVTLIMINIFCFAVVRFSLLDYIRRFGLQDLITSLFVGWVGISLASIVLYGYGLNVVLSGLSSYEGQVVGAVTVDKGIPRYVGFSLDPNIYTVFLSLPLCLAFFGPVKVGFLAKYFLLALLILTWSRAGLIAFFVAAAAYGFVSLSQLSIKRLTTILPFLLIMFCLVLAATTVPDIADMINKRIEGVGRASGRFHAWENGIEVFSEHFLVGIGLYSFYYWNMKYFDDPHHLHNTYLDILVESGLIGIMIYMVFVALLFVNALRMSGPLMRFAIAFTVFNFIMISSLTASSHEGFIFNVILLTVFTKNHFERNEGRYEYRAYDRGFDVR